MPGIAQPFENDRLRIGDTDACLLHALQGIPMMIFSSLTDGIFNDEDIQPGFLELHGGLQYADV